MTTSRLEAFSDGVIAIIITIMVLELKIPHGFELIDLQPLIPIVLAYMLSFQVVGTYWNNHHHLVAVAKTVTPKIMWANLYLLFCLSLIPFATGWMGENYAAHWPTALYGILLLLTGFSYQMLLQAIIESHPNSSELLKKIGNNIKGKISLGCYSAAVLLAFVNPAFSDLLYVTVALVWFIPDRRLVRTEK